MNTTSTGTNMREKNDCKLLSSIVGEDLIEAQTVLESSSLTILEDCVAFPLCPYAGDCESCRFPDVFANDIGLFPDGSEEIDGRKYQRYLVLHSPDLVILTDGFTLNWRRESKFNDEPLVRIYPIDDLLYLCGYRRKRFLR